MRDRADRPRRLKKRRRGVLLSESGRLRIAQAQRRHEEATGGTRLSLERLSLEVGLSAKTLSRVLGREMPVDLRTLELLFSALGISVSAEDYMRAEAGAEVVQALPQRRSAFFGRVEQLARLRELLAEKRLITLTGSGGVGKTRLALEAATRFGDELFDRVAYCDLSVVTEAALVSAAVARAFGARPDEREPQSAIEQIVERDRALLVIDNCEHVLSSVADAVDGLLTALPHLVALATSREPIGLEGEVVVRVPPFAVPPESTKTVAAALAHPAVALFVDRARGVDDGFAFDEAAVPIALEIVSRVQGIPLTIELAASRVATTALPEIAQSLRDHMSALEAQGANFGSRHRSARALVDWSYNLLDEDERSVFRCLAVFMGDFDCAAVESVCLCARSLGAVHVIARLVRKSLLFIERAVAPTRYRMLETVRQYAARELQECGEAAATRLNHALYYAGLLARARDASPLTGQRQNFAVISMELENVREALDWSIHRSHNLHIAADLCSSLRDFWESRGEFAEGVMWLRGALACDPELCRAETRAQLHEGLGLMLYRQGSLDAAIDEGQAAQRLFAEADSAVGSIRARNLIGIATLDRGDADGARRMFERNVREAQNLQDDTQLSVAFNNLGRVFAEHDGKPDLALDYFARSLDYSRNVGLTAMSVIAIGNLAEASAECARYADAIALARRGMNEAREIENWAMNGVLAVLIAIYRIRLDGFPAAADDVVAAIEAFRDHPRPTDLGNDLISLASAFLDAGDAQHAALLAGAIASLSDRSGQYRGAQEQRLRALETRLRALLASDLFRALHLRGSTYSIDEALAEIVRTP